MIDSDERYNMLGYAGGAPEIAAKTDDSVEVRDSSDPFYSVDFVSRKGGASDEFAFISLTQLRYIDCETGSLLAKTSALSPVWFRLTPVPGPPSEVYTVHVNMAGKNLYMTMDKKDSGTDITFEEKAEEATESGGKEPAPKQKWRFIKTGGPSPLLIKNPNTENKPSSYD